MNLPPVLRQRYLDTNGNPLSGGKLYTYQAGTTTPQATYTDYGGLTANANPVVLDANGEAPMWLDPDLSYKFVLKDSNDVTQWTIDNVVGLLDTDSVTTDSLQDGVLSADANGRAKMAAGFFSADAAGLGKFADGFLTADATGRAKVAAGFFSADATGLGKFADGFLTADATGRAKMANGFVTQEKRAALGHQLSSSSGAFNTNTLDTWTDVTNLTVTITTTGRPVRLELISDGTQAAPSGFGVRNTASEAVHAVIAVARDGTKIGYGSIHSADYNESVIQIFYPPSIFAHVDVPSAGTYTYKIQVYLHNLAGSLVYANNMKLLAYEL